jgi:hypothetical protein
LDAGLAASAGELDDLASHRPAPIEDFSSERLARDTHAVDRKQLSPELELDHIDGNYQNNALGNLRLMCPNCHSLTPTFRGRNKRPAPTLDSAA